MTFPMFCRLNDHLRSKAASGDQRAQTILLTIESDIPTQARIRFRNELIRALAAQLRQMGVKGDSNIAKIIRGEYVDALDAFTPEDGIELRNTLDDILLWNNGEALGERWLRKLVKRFPGNP